MAAAPHEAAALKTNNLMHPKTRAAEAFWQLENDSQMVGSLMLLGPAVSRNEILQKET
jgi:hypothetical protein